MSTRPAAPGRTPLIAGNWKMNGNQLEAIALVQKLAFGLNDKDFDATEVVVLPPFTSLRSVQTLVAGDKLRIGYGAQDVSPHRDGAHTGDISAAMLAKLGCSYVLAGHSERRQHHGEDDALVNAKIKAVIGTGEVATPDDAQQVCAAIRERISVLHSSETAAAMRILYGGSVKAGNISAMMDEQDVDGALVGGASLDAGEFVRICRYREDVQRGLSRQ